MKVGKTAGPFRYNLNQIPYDYTVEVRNRFKGLELIGTWRTMDGGLWHCTRDRDQDHPQEKEIQKGKMAVWGGLTNSCEKKRSEKERRKGKIYLLECRDPKNSKVKSLSRVRLFATPRTAAYQAPLSMGFSRQEYWSGLPFTSPGDFPNPGIEPRSPTLQADALTSEPPRNPQRIARRDNKSFLSDQCK